MLLPIPAQQLTIHLDAPELKVYSDASLKLMVLQACGVVPTEVYRRGLSLATEIAIKEQFCFWLVNNREGGIITPADQIWANEVNVPRLARARSLRKMAFIEPRDLHSKLILESMMDRARAIFPFEMQFFEDIPGAYSWFLDNAATVLSAAIPLHAVQEDGDAA